MLREFRFFSLLGDGGRWMTSFSFTSGGHSLRNSWWGHCSSSSHRWSRRRNESIEQRISLIVDRTDSMLIEIEIELNVFFCWAVSSWVPFHVRDGMVREALFAPVRRSSMGRSTTMTLLCLNYEYDDDDACANAMLMVQWAFPKEFSLCSNWADTDEATVVEEEATLNKWKTNRKARSVRPVLQPSNAKARERCAQIRSTYQSRWLD